MRPTTRLQRTSCNDLVAFNALLDGEICVQKFEMKVLKLCLLRPYNDSCKTQ